MPRIKVHVLIRGRIGDGWYDLDEKVKLEAGTTLGQLLERGDRCPVDEHRDRALADGDELYLLAPLAGG